MPAIEFSIDPMVSCTADEVSDYAARVATKLGLRFLRAIPQGSREHGPGVGRIIFLLAEEDGQRLPEVGDAMELRFAP